MWKMNFYLIIYANEEKNQANLYTAEGRMMPISLAEI
jgi:hypothetical protein